MTLNKTEINAYQKTSIDAKVLGASPHELVRLVMERLCEKIEKAAFAINTLNTTAPEKEKATTIENCLAKSGEIVLALRSSLIETADPEFFHHMSNIYNYIQQNIATARFTKNKTACDKALTMSKKILAIWNLIPHEFHEIHTQE